MCNLYNIDTIKKILKKYRFKINKNLGQNFIIDSETCKKMAQECSISNEKIGIIEIGSGIGTLTKELAKISDKIITIEKDDRLICILNETLKGFSNIKIINSDVFDLDLGFLLLSEFDKFDKVMMCANLPYYITSKIIMKILEENINIHSMIFMLQKESAERICAIPGDKKCGSISVSIRYYSEAEILFNINKTKFFPEPKVNSSVVKIIINKNKFFKINNKDNFFRIVRAGFRKKRKKLINNLSSEFRLSKKFLENIFLKNNINLLIRAENLSFDDFVFLENNLKI
ncbi:MAG: 16S rRNA (adenine(1518)-N(6)/adenine(1519)-N(6)) -dimethyltransferase RsmA [Candidatus Paraimprobicoccus trichonymphae]|uniref:Ribosomal RNA small subunit methyltransferase A n=1 Tax=Candidatus Paraimprobicoccus trichonymphae TaxID=3033793 RepID=A0AA48KW97_9FIRM|nr:MAG: 16S rRNA (adenine(1518)-N(6)/adenine(1519)-N(6)) -dimethyltransferase RsmA [Candidatus Paraimprobicoccus trichonymphae]